MLRLDLECIAGTPIDLASEHAQRVADMLGIYVGFEFNGVRCLAVPGGDAVHLAASQQSEQNRQLRTPFDTRFASSKRRIFIAKEGRPDAD